MADSTHTWNNAENVGLTIDGNTTIDFATGGSDNNVTENGIKVNLLSQHWFELQLNSEKWVSSLK